LKTGGAQRHRSSNLLLSVPISKDNSSKNKVNNTQKGINTKDFEKFLKVQRNLSPRTIEGHLYHLSNFLNTVENIDGPEAIQDFLLKIKEEKSTSTYRNYLSMLKILYRDYLGKEDYIKDFKFPRQSVKPKILPSRKELKIFFEALPSMEYQIIFLALASSGLRISELLNVEIVGRMLIPLYHDGNTKKSWISFINEETENLIESFEGAPFEVSRNTVSHVFKGTSHKTGIKLSAQTLRSVFAHEITLKKVPDRYIDAFCGRVPSSVLARHYSDFSPEVLKEIYDKADLTFF